MKFSSVPVWTMAQKLPGSQPEQKPGPGNYNSNKNGKSEPNFSFGKAERQGIIDGEDLGVGPGNYNYNVSSLGKMGGAPLKAKQRNPIRQSDEPGPGQYSDVFQLGRNEGYSVGKERRMDIAQSNNHTAPGDYNPKYSAIQVNAKKTKFGTEQRLQNAESYELNVGPGAYNWDKGVKKGGYVKFGKDDRNAFVTDPRENIGPGTYNTNYGKDKKNGWTIQKRNRPLAGGTGEVPGPGNYKSCGTLSKQGYSYGKGSRNVGYDNAVPGPGMYDKKGTLDKHGSKFGRDTRNTMGKNDLNIGPGQYNHSKIGKNATSSFSFGKSVRQGIANENSAPGPGAYGKNSNRNAGGWSIGKAKRPPINGGKGGNEVGPGQYGLKNGYRGGYSFGKDHRKTVETHMTPGFYKIPSSVPDVPKYLLKYD